MTALLPLTADDVVRIECRARKIGPANCWTGTSGTLAADVIRLLGDRSRLLVEIAQRDERRELPAK